MENDALGYGLQRCVSGFGVPFLRFGQFVVDECVISCEDHFYLKKSVPHQIVAFVLNRLPLGPVDLFTNTAR